MSQTTALIQGQREEGSKKKIIIALPYLVICNEAKASMSLTKQTPTGLPFYERKAIIHPLFCFFFLFPPIFLISMEYAGTSRRGAWMDISKLSNFIKRCLWWGRALVLNIQQPCVWVQGDYWQSVSTSQHRFARACKRLKMHQQKWS